MVQKLNRRCSGLDQMRNPASPTVVMSVYKDFRSCSDMESEWDSFVEQVSGDIFLTYDWCRIWWKHYGRDRTLRIYVFHSDNQLVGLLPMFLEKIFLGPIAIHRAKMVGSDFTFGQFRPAVAPDYLGPVVYNLISDLGSSSCDQVVLGPLAGRYSAYEELVNGLRNGTKAFSVRTDESHVQTYYRLTRDYDQWLQGFNAAQRSNFRREYRLLEKQAMNYTFEPSTAENWEEMFDDFVQLHQAYWHQQGKLGHFGDWPQSLAFHREMARAQVKKDRLRLLRLRCSDDSRSYTYNYRCGDTYYEFLLARTLVSPRGVSLGRLLHSEAVKFALFDSVQWIDSMQGKYGYKCQQGGEYFPLRYIFLDRKGIRSRMRVWLFNRAAWLLHLFYYKIYFCRLAVKLPRKWRRELRPGWIRTCSELRGSLKPSEYVRK